MQVRLKAVGELREHFGREPQDVELPEGATFRSLLTEIGARWGAQLPPQVWDGGKGEFRGAVYLVRNGHAVLDPATMIEDGEEIVALRALSGG
jgi:molybdopterin converting factor small subunit